MANAAVTSSLAERLQEFGGIAADRVRLTPAPGSATIDDLVRVNADSKPLCELKGEMSRKRIEYFHSGVRLVWMVDCVDRSVAVYTSPSDVRVLTADDTLDGGDVLPGFTSPIADLFADLDFNNEVR